MLNGAIIKEAKLVEIYHEPKPACLTANQGSASFSVCDITHLDNILDIAIRYTVSLL